MRCLVCSEMDRAAAELFSVAETVPAVRRRRAAIVLSVTLVSCGAPLVFLGTTVPRSLQGSVPQLLTRMVTQLFPIWVRNSRAVVQISPSNHWKWRRPQDFRRYFSVASPLWGY